MKAWQWILLNTITVLLTGWMMYRYCEFVKEPLLARAESQSHLMKITSIQKYRLRDSVVVLKRELESEYYRGIYDACMQQVYGDWRFCHQIIRKVKSDDWYKKPSLRWPEPGKSVPLEGG